MGSALVEAPDRRRIAPCRVPHTVYFCRPPGPTEDRVVPCPPDEHHGRGPDADARTAHRLPPDPASWRSLSHDPLTSSGWCNRRGDRQQRVRAGARQQEPRTIARPDTLHSYSYVPHRTQPVQSVALLAGVYHAGIATATNYMPLWRGPGDGAHAARARRSAPSFTSLAVSVTPEWRRRGWQTATVDPASEPSESVFVDVETEAAQQQAMIAALALTLNVAPVRYWLMGGWAVDAHLGRTTRRHSDIDFAVFFADRSPLKDALGTHGLVSVPGAEPAGEFFDGGPCRVEITYLVETSYGEMITPGFEHWPYIRDAFDADAVLVNGVEVPILSVAALIDTKQHWQDHIGQPMRPPDLVDLDALRALGEPATRLVT